MDPTTDKLSATLRAPAKLNLGLALGPRRDDGLHELRSLFCPLALADRIVIEQAGEAGDDDEVQCPGVEGPNLAARALQAMREDGWRAPPLRVRVEKRIPVAAGLGGGSADAAAVLRFASAGRRAVELAARIGADVPSQVDPRPAIVGGAGERVEPVTGLAPFSAVVIPHARGLSTADVYGEADRLGLGSDAAALDRHERAVRSALALGALPFGEPGLLANDLEPAALSLRPEIGEALSALRDAGAAAAFVAGSGPTAVGLFAEITEADRASRELAGGWGDVLVTTGEVG